MHKRVHKTHEICIFIFNSILFLNILYIFFLRYMLEYID